MFYLQTLMDMLRKIIAACNQGNAHQNQSSKSCPSRSARVKASASPLYEPIEQSQNQDLGWNTHGHTPPPPPYDLQNTFNDERVQFSAAPIIYDVTLSTSNDERLYRRLLLDTTVETDIISDDIAQLLGKPVEEGYGAEIQLPDGRTVKSVGVIGTTWQIYRSQEVHNTRFHVVRDRRYDLVLGRT